MPKDNPIAPSGLLYTFVMCRLESKDSEDLAVLELECNRPPWSARMFLEEFQNPASRLLGVLYDSRLIGYAVTHLVAEEGYVLKLGVLESFRGQGLGRAFLGWVLDDLKGRGAQNVWLEVRQGNYIAQNLYRSFGFTSRGVRVAYYSDDGKNALVMAYEFPTGGILSVDQRAQSMNSKPVQVDREGGETELLAQ